MPLELCLMTHHHVCQIALRLNDLKRLFSRLMCPSFSSFPTGDHVVQHVLPSAIGHYISEYQHLH